MAPFGAVLWGLKRVGIRVDLHLEYDIPTNIAARLTGEFFWIYDQ
jgi:hypothetical protein